MDDKDSSKDIVTTALSAATKSQGDPRTAISWPARFSTVSTTTNKCWLCNQDGNDVAHVFPRSDHILFEEHKLSGLMDIPSLNSILNLMFLCTSCHSLFDSRAPAWAFLPMDLDCFIEAEEEFQTARALAALEGIDLAPTRQIPKTERDGRDMIYARYQIRRGFLSESILQNMPCRRWGGSPIVAILRCAGILAGPVRLPESEWGIPDEVVLKLQHLLFLYGIPRPLPLTIFDDSDGELVEECQPCTSDRPSNGDAGNVGGHWQPEHHEPDGPDGSGRRDQSRPSGSSSQNDDHEVESLLSFGHTSNVKPHTPPDDSAKRAENRPNYGWTFGPGMTSEEVAKWYNGVKED